MFEALSKQDLWYIFSSPNHISLEGSHCCTWGHRITKNYVQGIFRTYQKLRPYLGAPRYHFAGNAETSTLLGHFYLFHCVLVVPWLKSDIGVYLGWNRTLERVLEILTLASDFLQLSTNPWKQNSTGGCLLTRGCILRCKNHDRSVKAEPGGVHTQGRRQQGASAETSRWQALKRSRMNQKRALSATNGRCATKQAGRIATRDHWKRSMYKGRSVHAEKKDRKHS